MRRWNGWGDDGTIYPLPESAADYLTKKIGEGSPTPDAPFKQVIAAVPASRLAPHPLVITDPAERALFARGQSLPDWIALRSGHVGVFPDGVAHPSSEEDVRKLLEFANRTATRLIPYGGGTSVVGHVSPQASEAPVLTVHLANLKHLLDFDETSQLATFEAGVTGPSVESQLHARGFTLGHFPQSWELSTLGGWIATRSSGQQSFHYGRIEQLFAGGHIETPLGPWDLPALPASAAGPDLREIILGSEGRLGVITRAIVRVRPLPERERFLAAFFRTWDEGVTAVRAVAQEGVPVSMMRLSDGLETETTLALSGHERLVAAADRALQLLRFGAARCLLIYALTGNRRVVNIARRRAGSILRAHGGLPVGSTIGELWRQSRFLTPYLRNTLWERGYAIDTLETALPWSKVNSTAAAILTALRGSLQDEGEKVLAFGHLSHIYRDGASIYITLLFRLAEQSEDSLRRWRALKSAASQVIVAHGGTISHQHGVGRDHAPYLPAEKGKLGMKALEALQRTIDPKGTLNPGTLLEDN